MTLRLSLSLSLGGAVAGLALLAAFPAGADESLREQVRREFGHRNYVLMEDEDGARLYLFRDANNPAAIEILTSPPAAGQEVRAALDRTSSEDPRERVRGLVELAGVDSPEALDAALALLGDPSAAVREEAANLILDHPGGESMALAIGLADEDD